MTQMSADEDQNRFDPQRVGQPGGRDKGEADFPQMRTDAGDQQTRAIIPAAMEVHNQLGHGFLEPVYHESLARELASRGIPYEHEFPLPVYYKGEPLPCSYRCDFVCYGEVLVELKALSALTPNEYSQVINYLKASRHERALLVNFGAPRLECKRFVLSNARKQSGPPAST